MPYATEPGAGGPSQSVDLELLPPRQTHNEVEGPDMARVLVIDDDERVRAYLRRALESGGYWVDEAEDGDAGLRACRALPYDVVLCDIFMPKLNGLETIRALRPEQPGLPIIAMSGGVPGTCSDPLPEAQRLGACQVLYKPFSLAALLLAVESARSLVRPGV